MILSLALILLAAGVIYLFIPHDDSKDPVRKVSYRVELDTARRAAPYPVAAPVGLGREWRATSVTYQGNGERGAAWHLGFVTPREQYAAVEQSDQRASRFVGRVTQGARKTERGQEIDGERWTRYQGDKYDALVLEKPGVTTVVTGTAGFAELARLAGALEASGGKDDPTGKPSPSPSGS